MSKNILIGIGIVAVLVIVGAVAYILRPPAEASEPIEAISVNVETRSIFEVSPSNQPGGNFSGQRMMKGTLQDS